MCRRALSGSRWLARGARGCVCGGRAAPQEAAKPSASRPWSVRWSPLINAETSQHTSSVECWLGSAIIRGRTARSAGSRGASGGALDHLQRSSALADGLGRLRARRHAAPTPQARLRLGRRHTTPAWRQPLFHWLWSLSAGPAVLPDGSHPELRHGGYRRVMRVTPFNILFSGSKTVLPSPRNRSGSAASRRRVREDPHWGLHEY